MRKKIMSTVFAVFLGALLFPLSSAAKDGGVFYTKQNIWYEHPEKILSTNYHKGEIIPAGTAVEIVKQSGKKITFREEESGAEYTLHLVKKYTDLNKEEFFNRYFSDTNILKSSEYKSFSDMEKKNIQEGKIEEGMSKEAVLMAYGYPPSHRTPSLESSSWIVWESRMVNRTIYFKNNKISRIS